MIAMSNRNEHRRRQSGLALLIVLWTVLMLTIIAGLVQQTSRTDLNIARNMIDRTRAELLADGAVEVAVLGLLDARRGRSAWKADGTVYAWREGDAEIRVRVTPESGRIDINAAPPELLTRLMQAAGADEALARQIAAAAVDFRDGDHERSPDGVEDPDYQALGKPLGAKDAPFTLAEELMRVPGMTADLYERIAPGITVYTNQRRPDPAAAPAIVRAALGLDGVGSGTRRSGGSTQTVSSKRPSAVRQGSGGTTGLRSLLRVETEARLDSGGLFVRHAVIYLVASGPQRHRKLMWDKGNSNLH